MVPDIRINRLTERPVPLVHRSLLSIPLNTLLSRNLHLFTKVQLFAAKMDTLRLHSQSVVHQALPLLFGQTVAQVCNRIFQNLVTQMDRHPLHLIYR